MAYLAHCADAPPNWLAPAGNAEPLARLLLPYSFPQQGRASSMSDLDPHDRINWWSLTCNTAPEWRLMMEEARPRPLRSVETGKPQNVVHLRRGPRPGRR